MLLKPQFFLCDAKFYFPGQAILMRDKTKHLRTQMSSTMASLLSTMEQLIHMPGELLVLNNNTIQISSTITSSSNTPASSSTSSQVSMIKTSSTTTSNSSNMQANSPCSSSNTWVRVDILSKTPTWAWCLLVLLATQVNNRALELSMSPPTTERWSSELTKPSSSSQARPTITRTPSRGETL